MGCGEHIEVTEVGQYIKHALESKENECTKFAAGIISDLSNIHFEKMADFLDDFVPCLHEILRDQSVHRDTKIPALGALADLAINCPNKFCEKYLQWTMQILDLAAKSSVNVAEFQKDQDALDFLKDLREELISMYTTFLIAIQDAKDAQYLLMFSTQLGGLFNFIDSILAVEGYSNEKSLRNTMALIGDICIQFPQNEVVRLRAR